MVKSFIPNFCRVRRHEQLLSYFGRKIGFRFLRAKKSSSILSLNTVICIGGVAVGVLTMIVTLSVMAGFEDELKKRLFLAETHILIESKNGFFQKDETLLAQVTASNSHIEKIFPVLQTEAILRASQKVAGSIVKGVSSEHLEWLKQYIVEWAPQESSDNNSSELFLGQEMALDLGVSAGDFVTIVSPLEGEGPLGVIPRVKRFLIAGIYKTNVLEQELHVVFSKMENIESFLRQRNVLSQIEVRLSQLEDAPKAVKEIQKKIDSTFLVRSWQDLNAHLFQALKLERVVMFCILIFIVVVASFNIMSTLTMMIIEKKKSLSILRAMGATAQQIASIFLWQGSIIGLLGIFIGSGLAIAVCRILTQFPIIELPEFYYDRSLPVILDFTQIGLVVSATLGVVFFASLLPARKLRKLTPLEGIQKL